MSRLTLCAAALALLGVGCGKEPDRIVQSRTSDGAFALTLEAQANWVRPGESVPVLVRVESLTGPVSADLVETVELVADNGTVFPTVVMVTLTGPDATGAGAQSRYSQWVVFTASSMADSSSQGQVHALFRDVQATLLIRITAAYGGT